MAEYKNRDSVLVTSGEIVGFYEREFCCFSNFSSFAVKWRGRDWPTSEHAYQAAHFLESNPGLANRIQVSASAHAAYTLAHENKDDIPSDWDERKIGVMEQIVRCKLEQHPYIQKKLRQTGNRIIVEDSPKDSFWGWGPDKNGRNELGKIWVKLREELDKTPVNINNRL
jgi:ribA/ribD-fused uncharacterized protein